MSDTTTPAEYRNQVAPWPKRQDEVTAESLYKALAARAYAIDLDQMLHDAEQAPAGEQKAKWREFGAAAERKNRDTAIVALLEHLGDDQYADEMAQTIWALFEFGEADECLYDWLTKWGITPERLLPAKATA